MVVSSRDSPGRNPRNPRFPMRTRWSSTTCRPTARNMSRTSRFFPSTSVTWYSGTAASRATRRTASAVATPIGVWTPRSKAVTVPVGTGESSRTRYSFRKP